MQQLGTCDIFRWLGTNRMTPVISLVLGLWLVDPLASLAALPTGDGLYAVFDIHRGASPLGQFVCRLEFERTPRTAANFVGLAEGLLPWVDFNANHPTRRPFFDGITFHRVIAGFVIQGGSPNGQGTDGPGYSFRDEIVPTLRHSKAGILSMANSGPHSNGSQFFVTLAPTPWLDDLHSVFGEVVSGMDIVNAVKQGDVMERVSVVRNGAAALAFSPLTQGLPTVGDAGLTLERNPAGFSLSYPKSANAEYYLFHADGLRGWSQLEEKELQGLASVLAVKDVTAVTSGKAAHYFMGAKVQYPDSLLTPLLVSAKQLSLTDAAGYAFTFNLTNASSGNYTFKQATTVLGPNRVSNYSWDQEPYRGRFFANISGLSSGGFPVTTANLSFLFANTNSGSYAGSLGTSSGQSIALKGSFTLADAPP